MSDRHAAASLIPPNQAEFDHAVTWAKEQRKLSAAAYSARVRGFRRGAGRMYALRAKAEIEVIGVARRALCDAAKATGGAAA